MADWSEWFQQQGSNVIDKWSNQAYSTPIQVQGSEMGQLGTNGYYVEGKPGVANTAKDATGVSKNTLMIGGAALLLVVVLLAVKG